MTTNVGSTDKIARIVVAVVAAALALFVVKGTLAIVLWVVAAIMLLTGLVGFCPIYRLFGINTCKVPSRR
ncbi:MAG TPA: DUF2892 domain-containing protein [Dermatophilaceae bacterium]|nr:DUF2892 domain-containing protein [Dermatophilaceae bacterium]